MKSIHASPFELAANQQVVSEEPRVLLIWAASYLRRPPFRRRDFVRLVPIERGDEMVGGPEAFYRVNGHPDWFYQIDTYEDQGRYWRLQDGLRRDRWWSGSTARDVASDIGEWERWDSVELHRYFILSESEHERWYKGHAGADWNWAPSAFWFGEEGDYPQCPCMYYETLDSYTEVF